MKPTSSNIFVLLALAAAAIWGAYFALESMLADDAGMDEMYVPEEESWDEEEPEPEQEAEKPEAPGERPRQAPGASPGTVADEGQPAPIEPPTSTRTAAERPAATEGPSAEEQERQQQEMAETMEVMKKRHVKLQERFDGEKRDPSWAKGKERRVRNLFQDAGRENLLVSVECRATLCRLEARLSATSDYFALLEMPGLKEELSEESLALPQGPPNKRTLVNYFAKHGYTLERLAR